MSTNSELPSYEELFAQLDFKEGDDARSVYSPAAYLTDLLQLLDDEFISLQIDRRRADIKQLLLNSENIYTLVPYLNIANEVLESKSGDTDIYKSLREGKYPFNLPFNFENERIKTFLGYLDVTLETLYKSFNNEADSANTIAREYLGLSQEEYDAFVQEITNKGDVKDYYKWPRNQEVSTLKKVEDFLERTELTSQELRELLYQNLDIEVKNKTLRLERVRAAEFFVNHQLGGYAILDNDEENLTWSTDKTSDVKLNWYERGNRFVRLAQKINLFFTNLDLILRSCCNNKLETSAIQKIAVIKQLHDQYKLPIDVICAFFSNINTLGMGDEEQPKDLFNRVFNLRFAEIEKKYILASDFIFPKYSKYNQLQCTGDILSLQNKEYRIRIGKALGISDKELTKIVSRFRSRSILDQKIITPLDVYPDQTAYEKVELPALSLLFCISKLVKTLDISCDDLFDLFDILEKDPIIRKFSNFDVLIHYNIQDLDCYKIISGNNIQASMWLVQMLFAIGKWMKSNGLTGEALRLLLTGQYREEENFEVATDFSAYREYLFALINNLVVDVAESVAFRDDAYIDTTDLDLDDEVNLTLDDTDDEENDYTDVAALDITDDLGAVIEDSDDDENEYIDTEALDTSDELESTIDSDDDEYGIVALDRNDEVEFTVNGDDGDDDVDVDVAALDSDDEIESTIDGNDDGDDEYVDITTRDLEILGATLYPSDLEIEAFETLTVEQRRELYDNLIFNGYIDADGTVLRPGLFAREENQEFFEVNTHIGSYAADILDIITSQIEAFQEEKITLDPSFFASLPLTETEVLDLVENLQFNEYLDQNHVFLDKEELLDLNVEDFNLALIFHPYRHKILKAIQEFIRNSKSSLYILSKDKFAEIADKILAHLIYERLQSELLNDDGAIKQEVVALFLDPDNVSAFTVSPYFTDQDTEVIFNTIAKVIKHFRQYQFTPEMFEALNFSQEEQQELFHILDYYGFLAEDRYIPADKIDYFLNVNNALEFTLFKFEDHNKDVFFALHGVAKRINAAIQGISEKLKEIADNQEMVLLDAAQEIFGLEKEVSKVVFHNFFRDSSQVIESFMAPLLAVVNAQDEIMEEPRHNRFNVAYRRMQQFAMLVSALRLSKEEVEMILKEQNIIEKFPEPLILPETVDSIDALLESPEGIIYLFKDRKHWTYSAETHQRFTPDELEAKLLAMGYSEALSKNIAKSNDIASLSEHFKDTSLISKIDAAFVDKNGKSFIFAGGYSYGREKNSSQWIKIDQVWGQVKNQFENPQKIHGTFQDKDGKTYLFFENQYVRYSGSQYNHSDEGYPLEIEENWKNEGLNAQLPEEFHQSIDASFQGPNDKTYLFKEHAYVCSDTSPYNMSIDETWGHVKNNFDYAGKVDATYADGGQYYLFSGDQVILYRNSLENEQVFVEDGFPKRIESHYTNLPSEFKSGVDAAFKGDDGNVYLFRENQFICFPHSNPSSITQAAVKTVWSKVSNNILNPQPGTKQIDAAFVGLEGKTYLFNGTQYFRYSGDDYSQVDEGFPRTIHDDWGGLKTVDAAFILDGKTYLFGKGASNKGVYSNPKSIVNSLK